MDQRVHFSITSTIPCSRLEGYNLRGTLHCIHAGIKVNALVINSRKKVKYHLCRPHVQYRLVGYYEVRASSPATLHMLRHGGGHTNRRPRIRCQHCKYQEPPSENGNIPWIWLVPTHLAPEDWGSGIPKPGSRSEFVSSKDGLQR